MTAERAQNMPQLTAGGRSEADMATPTREPALPPRTDRATPASVNSVERSMQPRVVLINTCTARNGDEDSHPEGPEGGPTQHLTRRPVRATWDIVINLPVRAVFKSSKGCPCPTVDLRSHQCHNQP